MKRYILGVFLTIVCSFGLTHSTIAQGRDAIRTDSVGVVLTHDGFRKVLLQRSDLMECRELYVSAQRKNHLLEMRVDLKNVQITSFQSIRDTQAGDIKKLKRMVWKKNFEIWAWRAAVGILTYKLIFR